MAKRINSSLLACFILRQSRAQPREWYHPQGAGSSYIYEQFTNNSSKLRASPLWSGWSLSLVCHGLLSSAGNSLFSPTQFFLLWIQLLYQQILFLPQLPKMRSVFSLCEKPCGGMMIGLPRPHDFLEAHHQDQVFRLLGLQVMCPVLWMYPPRGKSVTMTSWVRFPRHSGRTVKWWFST